MSYITHPQYQMLATRPPPMGWVGAWPPPVGWGPLPPGFPGPPPAPTGVPVNPNQWAQGQWVFNPAFRALAYPGLGQPGVPPNYPVQLLSQWAAPWQSWGVPQNQVPAGANANYNPNKRVPRPPDPSYWETKLTDNGLGLENMHIRADDPAPTTDLHVPETPWTWAPQGLPDNNDQGRRASSSRDTAQDQRVSQGQGRPQDQSRQSSSSYPQQSSQQQSSSRQSSSSYPQPSSYPQQPSSSYPQSGSGSFPPPTSFPQPSSYDSQRPSPNRASRSGEPSPTDPGRRQVYEYPTYRSSSSRSPEPNSRYQDRDRRHHTDPSPQSRDSLGASSHHHRTSTQPRTPTRSSSREPETFTAKRELQPTFSPNIIRTPGHTRNASLDGDGNRTPTRNGVSSSYQSNSLGPIAEASSSSQYYQSRQAAPLRAAATVPADAFIPPPMVGSYPSRTTNPNPITNSSRYTDEPDSMLSPLAVTIPPQGPPQARPLARHHSEPPTDYRTTQEAPVAQRRSDRSTPHPRGNPFPQPPVDRSHQSVYGSMPTPSAQRPAVSPRRRLRKGFWNRRGDHLTHDGFIVYAPPERANPSELSDYPSTLDGYRNHKGEFMRYDPARQELPESMTLRGEPPRIPYASFIEYVMGV
ncbi:hypothetical protein JAAARDRAFT_191673 [Jaapia argillacea MUCL 33604]|uniref:Uncharacterized protein n=1 Tax=Jaapia argillacea MUCL 33604 TaxID=933084 RepID=A0A067PZX1_9AGAM|nr:hypothetical protein JAAARDRAFT_191673 [Jaapia argillacea MUCL 33604]